MKKSNFTTIGSRPNGLTGAIAGKLMNIVHYGFYKNIINKHVITAIKSTNQITVLDVGCGGGVSVKIFANSPVIKKIYGIDYSDDMVELSRKFNSKEISDKKAEVLIADVSELPFNENHFDIITAFDTINFWPNHKQAISEILRILKKGGSFFIINSYPKEGTKWYDFVKFKDESEYKEYLNNNGFNDVKVAFEKNTIIIKGRKP